MYLYVCMSMCMCMYTCLPTCLLEVGDEGPGWPGQDFPVDIECDSTSSLDPALVPAPTAPEPAASSQVPEPAAPEPAEPAAHDEQLQKPQSLPKSLATNQFYVSHCIFYVFI